ncbi:MAG TPA: radical SAM protein [Flavisolibacter sp.]|jgi:radical SAM superfamily enzyme YgiQ (UPF0313 family)|nr:radical SAM protein [Flavisolibacter sp.]
MKIILTHGYFLKEDEKEKQIMRPYVPLGILYIAAFLDRNGYLTQVFDSTFSDFDSFCRNLLKEQPDVIGIYTNLMTKINVLHMIRFIRSQAVLHRTRIILGGPEVRNHVSNFLHHGADVLVLGEGEETMLELVQVYEKEAMAPIHDILGIAYLENGQVRQNAERTKIRELDTLPFPGRHKVNLQLYLDAWKSRHGVSTISINTMRGCPYSCKWCSRAVYGQSYRRRSPSNVADEMEAIQNTYSVDSIWFVDDVFTISHKWLQQFAEEIRRRKIRLSFECITRADRMNEEVIQLLKESGCFRVWIGAESGSQKIIDKMDRRVEVGQVRDMIRSARAGGLQAGTFIMVGYPGETKEDIYETVKHLKLSDPDLFTITVAYPIKGTPLYAEVENQFLTRLDWESSTDRDIDFVRTYKRKVYDHAIDMINREISWFKEVNKPQKDRWKACKLKVKALLARGRMEWAILRS